MGLAVASGRTSMADAVDLMAERGTEIFGRGGPASGKFAKLRDLWSSRSTAKYDPTPLRELIEEFVGRDTYIADLKRKVIVPAVNVTKGSPQVFKTPHHASLMRDWKLPLVDVALATSAAPTYFPLHTIGSERFADGGMYANSPDDLALHEAQHFLGQALDDVHILSIGTTTAKFSFSSKLSGNLGWLGWLMDERLTSAMIGSQQLNTDYIMRHKLGPRYRRVDEEPSARQLPEMTLDNATASVGSDLMGLAEASVRQHLPSIMDDGYFNNEVPDDDFLGREEVKKFIEGIKISWE